MTSLYGRRLVAAQALLAAPGHEPSQPPGIVLARHCVDISNYTTGLTRALLRVWATTHDVGLVIVQSLDKTRFPSSKTAEHLQQCADVGVERDLYVYPFFANGAGDCTRRLSEALATGVPIRRVWLDVEDVDPSQAAWTPSQRVNMVRQWLTECDAYPARLASGIYTGRWYWASQKYMANSTSFSDRLLWDSNYDYVDNVNYNFTSYGGWTLADLAIKQYAGTSTLAGVGGVDLNVLSEAERMA